jgi:hypothetical protein
MIGSIWLMYIQNLDVNQIHIDELMHNSLKIMEHHKVYLQVSDIF